MTFTAGGIYHIDAFVRYVGLVAEINLNTSVAAGGAVNETRQITIERAAASPVVGLQIIVPGIFYILPGDTLTLANGWGDVTNGSAFIQSYLTVYPLIRF